MSAPTTMRLGYRLSYSAFDSRRNSGLNRMFFTPYFAFTEAVNPTGTVLLTTMYASGFTRLTSWITLSTALVSKKFFDGS